MREEDFIEEAKRQFLENLKAAKVAALISIAQSLQYAVTELQKIGEDISKMANK
jgi:hypothetical protein